MNDAIFRRKSFDNKISAEVEQSDDAKEISPHHYVNDVFNVNAACVPQICILDHNFH
jgi:hypothetical protein